ncbi:MAG: hypothetical protein R3F56_15065 [Planctomycetota bacterium]
MRDLIYLLFQNPILLLVVVVWILSGIANAAAKAKRAQQRQAQSRRPGEPGSSGGPPRAAERQVRAPTARPGQQTAEEIARQLREMLGIETVPAPPPRPVQQQEPTPAWEDRDDARLPRHPEPDRGDRDRVPGAAGRVGELHQSVEARRRKMSSVASSVASHLGHLPTRASPAPHLRRRRVGGVFDPRRAAAAIVALEVLGPPRALRPYDDGPR